MAELTDEFLWKIAGRAGSLQERLSGAPLSVPLTVPVPAGGVPGGAFQTATVPDAQPETVSSVVVEGRLERWQKSSGGPTEWERLLSWSSLDRAGLAALGEVEVQVRTSDEILPAWALTLREILTQPFEESAPLTAAALGFADAAAVLPFEELLAPFVVWAARKLHSRLPRQAELFSPEAEAAFERNLRANLAGLAGLAFLTEFKVFCTRRQIFRLFRSAPAPTTSREGEGQNEGQSNSEKASAAPPPENKLYRGFVKQVQDDGYRTFFLEYSVLARMLVLAATNWVMVIAEFGERLRQDLPAIGREFGFRSEAGEGRGPGRLVQAETGLSDLHNHGRSVFRLKFESGLKLVYKPKDLRLEETFQRLLGWLNTANSTATTGELLPFKTIRVLSGEGYGWVEYVDQLPCEDEAGLHRYYRRLGMLLGLVHLLSGTDCHYENIIACGEHPVLIDTETLLHPHVPYLIATSSEDGEAAVAERAKAARLAHILEGSVLRTAMLPVITPDQSDTDFSAFAAVVEQQTSYHLPRWEHVNTDSMQVVYEKATVSPGQNVPALELEGFTLDLSRHAEDLLAGFDEMYRYMLAKRGDLLEAADSPLVWFEGLTGRFLFRNTKVYGMLLHYAAQPVYLREGVERSLHFEKLSRAFVLDPVKPAFWPVLAAERQSLEELDIPLFSCDTSKNALLWGEQSLVEDWFTASGCQAVRDRLREMGEADLVRQQAIIREALRSNFAGEAFDAEKFVD